MRSYKDKGKRIVELDDLSFISDRSHKLGWLRLHLMHFRIKFALSRADKVIVPSEQVAYDVSRYYFFPKYRIYISGGHEKI